MTLDNNAVHYNPTSPVPPTPSHDYVEIGGIKWATMNVGAESVTDYGLFFAWGDTQGYTAAQVGSGQGKKHFSENDYIYYNNGSYTKYNATDELITLQPTDDAVKAAWGGNWRMPTVSEWQALGEAVNTAWTQVNGVSGMMCTDKTDETKTLFFPACGYADYSSVDMVNRSGLYWSSSLNAERGDSHAYYLYFSNGNVRWNSSSNDRYSGCSVRGILDE